MQFPAPIERLIVHFRSLPGVGPRTATRFVFALLTKTEDELRAFGHALVDLQQSIRNCNTCSNLSLQNPCDICSDPRRSKDTICIVGRPQDIQAIEETHEYNGQYHVLGGTLNPIEGVTPDHLKIKELVRRLDSSKDKVEEIIFAFNPDLEGEATSLYLSKLLKPRIQHITRLARGLSQGADLEYADEVTLTNAIKGRREI